VRITTIVLCCAALSLAACSDSSRRVAYDPGDPETPTPEPVVLLQESERIPSSATPAMTPGSPGVVVDNPKLLQHFGSEGPDLNNAIYTRYFLSDASEMQPDAILVLVPGFEGGASNFAILADQLMRRMREETAMIVEVWAMDRRSEQLEDRAGLELAEQEGDAYLALDFLFGEELGLELDPRLVDGPNRRLITYNTSSDLAFIANWTPLVHSKDIESVVQLALSVVRNNNVFLGGHSAGTGYAARYAATDFDTESEAVDPGYQRLRGLVLLEGGGGALADPVSEDTLNRIEARFDGGLFGAVRDQAPRCVDGITSCNIETEASACAAFSNTACTLPTDAYAAGLINTETFAAGELVALDGDLNGDDSLSILQQDQNGIEGNSAFNQVPELFPIRLLIGTALGTSVSLYGQYLDDDGLGAAAAPFLAASVGAPGPVVDGLTTWLNFDEELPASVLEDNGPAPVEPVRGKVWGVEVEPTDFEGRILNASYKGNTNFFDWYYPSSGLGVTAELGLDTTKLSAPPPLGRGRSDIDNRTQAGNINIPVIGFGGSNGLTPVPGSFLAFAKAIGPCQAPACDGITTRFIDETQPSVAFPTYGDVSGGYEVYISEGYAHIDVLTAEDREDNQVIGPLVQFLQRNSE
jgi:pimeloyl-ACP methyl ester carboxylesterase